MTRVAHNKGIFTGAVASCLVCGKEVRFWPPVTRKYCSRACYFSTRRGENHPGWKGDDAGYDAIHDWINSRYGKPSECEVCGTTKSKRFDWHNMPKTYKRTRGDWKRVCSKCHMNIHKNWRLRWHA